MKKPTFASLSEKPVKPRGILTDHSEKAASKPEAKKSRAGRPRKSEAEERPTEKLSAYFTASEMDIIREKAGMVKLATHLRATLHELGYFKR